jgi:hypothetical protein
MALKAILPKEDYENLDEKLQEHYREVAPEKEGDEVTHYMLDAEGVEDVKGLKGAIRKERASNDQMRKLLKKFGVRPDKEDEVNTLMEKIGDRSIEDLLKAAEGKKADESELVKAAERKAEKKLSEVQEELDGAEEFIRDLLVNGEARRVLEDDELEGNVTLLLPHIHKQVEVVKDKHDGKVLYKSVVKDDETGEPRLGTGGKDFTIRDLAIDMRNSPEFAGAFKGTGASGSGAPPGGGTRSSGTTTSSAGAGKKGKPSADAVSAKKKTLKYNL